ncbi:hypothetical protein GGTG_07157 [Gaeumannomyces tritici R3-111a-1]|uniref:Uncharacterized protein n=1 Tax=Gaeumannomyces tritici (strain R3-111a-1) TaxID=644352 RepID=J3P0W1_GAET3|nr:hypothetical protein GGTG_07157 [Gaeumannomyces tritici R3-111a-1]EJT77245.1 hypothetical protein GGTG_07157 [Gaeumannomyces tritici R3-111a-1]
MQEKHAFIPEIPLNGAGTPPTSKQISDDGKLYTARAQNYPSYYPGPFLDLFTDDAVYVDHGAQIQVPRPYLEAHHRNWRRSHADFEIKADPAYPFFWRDVDEAAGNARVSFRHRNKGVFVVDLPRRKATGKPWEYLGVTDLVIEGGKIARGRGLAPDPVRGQHLPRKYIVIDAKTTKQVQRPIVGNGKVQE